MATIETIRQQDTARLRVEFALLYVAAPLAMALLLPPRMMFPMLFAVTLVGLILLGLTSGFRWRDLARGRERIVPRLVWGIGALVIAFGTLLLWLTQPEALFQIARERPLLLLMILVLYPLLGPAAGDRLSGAVLPAIQADPAGKPARAVVPQRRALFARASDVLVRAGAGDDLSRRARVFLGL